MESLFGIQRGTEQESLHLVAIVLTEVCQLLFPFHAFGYYVVSQLMSDFDDIALAP